LARLEVVDLSLFLPADVAAEIAPRVAAVLPRAFVGVTVAGVTGPKILVLVGERSRLKPEYYQLVEEIARRLGMPEARLLKRHNSVPLFILTLLGAFLGYSIACHYLPQLPGCDKLAELWESAYNAMKTLISATVVAGVVALAGYAYRAWGE